MIAFVRPLHRVTLTAWPLGAPVLLSFYLVGDTAAGCFISFAFFFGPDSLRIQPGLTTGWWDLPALFVRGARRPS